METRVNVAPRRGAYGRWRERLVAQAVEMRGAGRSFKPAPRVEPAPEDLAPPWYEPSLYRMGHG
jgi:hypothetical protein